MKSAPFMSGWWSASGPVGEFAHQMPTPNWQTWTVEMGTFESWLADLLRQRETEVRRLMRDPTALRFLIAWALYEAKCFDGFVKIGLLDSFAARVLAEGYDPAKISTGVEYFHNRYQDVQLYDHLMHRQSSGRMRKILTQECRSLSSEDRIFLATLVTYRFRNNMFHGNKGVQSWLQYSEQIRLCTEMIQDFVSHAEIVRPSLREEAA